MIIGLTGGIGSGKSTVSEQFAELGIDIVDADIVAREVVAKGTTALASIVEKFGEEILLPSGELNRAKLREYVFTNDSNKTWLNQLLHPAIRKEMTRQLEQAQSPYVLLVAPLLFENNLQSMVARVLVIDVSKDVQIERTVARDNSSPDVIKSIINSQIDRQERLKLANDVIDNSSTDKNELVKKIKSLHEKYIALSMA